MRNLEDHELDVVIGGWTVIDKDLGGQYAWDLSDMWGNFSAFDNLSDYNVFIGNDWIDFGSKSKPVKQPGQPNETPEQKKQRDKEWMEEILKNIKVEMGAEFNFKVTTPNTTTEGGAKIHGKVN